MKEKSLIFMFTESRYEYFTFMQDICYHTYESVVKDLTDFICQEFQFKQYWEKEKIRRLLYEKTEINYHCYEGVSGFACISGNLLNSDNILDCFHYSVSDLKLNYIIFSRKYDGTIHIYAFKDKKNLFSLVMFFDDKYYFECNNLEVLNNSFGLTENDLKMFVEVVSIDEMENKLSKIFKLPLSDALFDEFVKTSKNHETFGVGGRFDSIDDSEEECIDFFEFLDTVSPNRLIYTGNSFEISDEADDYASLHIISDNEYDVRKSVTYFKSSPVIPDSDKMDFYGKKKINFVFSILGDEFYNEVKKGTPLSKSLEKREIYCIKGNSNIYSLYSNAFFYDSVEDQIETYFSYDFPSYVIVFGYNEGNEIFIKLYCKADIPLSEIRIFSKALSKKNIWKSPRYLCDILKCDEQKFRKAIDKSNLKKTCKRISDITGLPINLSYEKIAKNPKLYNAKKWN